jgi:hypothetical protein
MATKGSTNLNRILRVTAHLLFEKGQGVSEVHGLMQNFVERPMLANWYQSYCENNGLPTDINRPHSKARLPMPPIDWDAITIPDLEAKTQAQLDWF